jgi:hypothetical protein
MPTNACTLALAAVLAVTPAASSELGEASWGGQHVALEVTSEGARVDFDCAHGTIDGPIRLDDEGRFDARGVYVKETPGPVRPEGLSGEPARYVGQVVNGEMTLSVVLVKSGDPAGTFTLKRGRLPRVVKCQ